MGFGFAFGGPEALFISGNANIPWNLALTSEGKARRFSFGDTLDFSMSAPGWKEADNVNNNSTWSGSEAGQTYYLALQNPTLSKDAWIALEYDDLGDKLTILSWAVAPSSMNMTAGQTPVPEPAETAAVMALLAAGAAVWRKRRQKVAA